MPLPVIPLIHIKSSCGQENQVGRREGKGEEVKGMEGEGKEKARGEKKGEGRGKANGKWKQINLKNGRVGKEIKLVVLYGKWVLFPILRIGSFYKKRNKTKRAKQY